MSRLKKCTGSALVGIAVLLLSASSGLARGGHGGGHGGEHGGGEHGNVSHGENFHGGGNTHGGENFHGRESPHGGENYHGGAHYSERGHVNRSFGGVESRGQPAEQFERRSEQFSGRGENRDFRGGRGVNVPREEWRHTQPWNGWGHGEAWYHGGEYHRHGYDYDRYAWRPYLYPGWFGAYLWPNYHYYGYDYGGPSYDYGYYTEPYGSSPDYLPPSQTTVMQEPPAQSGQTTTLGQEYLDQAMDAFRNENYPEALRLGGHAAVEMPQNPAVHELMSLAMFAQKEYRGAANEAHAALELGPPIDWQTLYSYYGNADTYTAQLRALEAFVRENPKDPAGHFLLGYQYTMTGSKDAAKKEFAQAVAITPKDKLAEYMTKNIK